VPGDGCRGLSLFPFIGYKFLTFFLQRVLLIVRLRQALVRKVVFEKIIYQQTLPRVYMAAIASALNPEKGAEVI